MGAHRRGTLGHFKTWLRTKGRKFVGVALGYDQAFPGHGRLCPLGVYHRDTGGAELAWEERDIVMTAADAPGGDGGRLRTGGTRIRASTLLRDIARVEEQRRRKDAEVGVTTLAL